MDVGASIKELREGHGLTQEQLGNEVSAFLEALSKGRCTSWRLHWSSGSGRNRRTRSRRFSGGKREALAALREFAKECEAAPVSSELLPEFTRSIADEKEAAGIISKNTAEQYRWAARVFDCCLNIKLSDIGSREVHAALARIAKGETPSGAPLSDKSLLNLVKVGRVSMDEAIARRLAASNPFRGVSVRQKKRERHSLSPAAAGVLLDSLGVQSAHEFAVSVIIRTGMRASEALGVRWRDVGEYVSACREVTKTDAGVRIIPLSDRDKEFIEKRREYLSARLACCGGVLEDSDRLCCGNDGRPLSYNALRLWWERHREGFGLDGWVLHDFRHTYVTNLAQAKVHPSVAQKLAGHSSIGVTMEIYTHVLGDDLIEAVGALDRARQ